MNALARLPDGARATQRIGEVSLVATVTLARLVPGLARRLRGGPAAQLHRTTGQVVSSALWRLGPAFVKFGQLLSTRQDVLPAGFCTELQTSLALGGGGRARYHADAQTEIGSVASVVRSRVDGTEVAVKQVHPGAAQQLRIDLGLLAAGSQLLRVVLPGSSLPQIVEEMCGSIRRQTDLVAEARTLGRLARLSDSLPVVIPRVLAEHSDQERLVMSWIPGQENGRTHRNGRRTARRLVLSVYEMLFVTGVVHCDLHPGNWWELPDGRIAMVDAGFAYELDEQMRHHFAEFFLGMASANSEICATHALAACAVPVPAAREEAFRRDMAELIRATTGLTAGSFSLVGFATRFFRIQRRHRAYSRASFIYPFMALLAIEGQVKQLDPGLNFQSLAAPVVLRSIVNRARYNSSEPPRA